jgi:circadian clock protein KaiC
MPNDHDHTRARPAPTRSPTISSGVPGLDIVLGGGFLRNNINLISGNPGAGKTTLGLQFLSAGASEGDRGMYVVLNETADELRSSAASHGLVLDGIEVVELLTPQQATPDVSLFQAGEVELSESANRILENLARAKPRRLVLDSVSALRLLFSDDLQFRHYLAALRQRLTEYGTTALLIEVGRRDRNLRALASGIVELQQLRREYGQTRRRLSVEKLRGTSYPSGYHDFNIDTGGLTVYPRVSPAFQPKATPARGQVSSGLAGFDLLLGGGLRYGSSALFLGASGTGKSVMATQFAVAAALRGEPALVFLIDELREHYIERARGLGIDIDGALASGRLRLERIHAVSISPGEFASKAVTAVDRDGVRLIVIDSLSGYMHVMSEERAVVLQLYELLSSLAERDVLTVLLLTEKGILGSTLSAPMYISFISDALLMFRFFESRGEIHRCLAVFKKRYGSYESTIRELRLQPGNVNLGPPLHQFTGVMTGRPGIAARDDRSE